VRGTASGEGARASPQPLEAETAPEASAAPSFLQGAPRGELGEPASAAEPLTLISRAPLGRLHGAGTIQAAHHCLDRLSASLAAEEQQLITDHSTLDDGWARFHAVVEEKR
jgi:hypothetical protein